MKKVLGTFMALLIFGLGLSGMLYLSYIGGEKLAFTMINFYFMTTVIQFLFKKGKGKK